ncbi:hypothetical protein Ssi03_74310 [Sphaerisporangium siamense]|uniref:Uncharacterized protein n=1 Tax=Sphaerisporangium siamense TaxID=795645 RepID=A0A7W7D8N7_9ACTN|nr:hypothetical protein [Sphaerisporangium siamense]MBB4702282.1 hypothetical protein [Sphaerisporangium siamense]GII89441.1 hypothetical protein Ssi03_74310 [Sphaerisporangium siamense]
MPFLPCLPVPRPGSSGRLVILLVVLLFVVVLSVTGRDPALALGVALAAVTAIARLDAVVTQIASER